MNPLKSLIVEDSKDDAALLVRHLSCAGYDVQSTIVQTSAEMKAALADGGEHRVAQAGRAELAEIAQVFAKLRRINARALRDFSRGRGCDVVGIHAAHALQIGAQALNCRLRNLH